MTSTSGAIGPRAGFPREALTGLWLVFLLWFVVGVVGVAWVGGCTASWLSGHGWAGPDFGFAFAKTLVTRGTRPLWPGVAPPLVGACGVALGALVVVPGTLVAWRVRSGRLRTDDPLRSLARAADVAMLTPAGVLKSARELRPSLRDRPAKTIDPAECGVLLGELRPKGPELRSSWEDVGLAVMAPRSGKTTAISVAAVLDAPGACVATANKADLWAATHGLRATAAGAAVEAFDPQQIAHVPQRFWFDILGGVRNDEDAHRLAGHFIQQIRGNQQYEFWSSAAGDILSALFLAAASSGRTLHDVREWLNDAMNPLPVDLLREHGHLAAAAGLAAKQGGAPETREGEYETARVAAVCLRDPAMTAWVTPGDGSLPAFDLDGFVRSRRTLYLMSKDGAGGAAPLVAAVTDQVVREAQRCAEAEGGRLDPPMTLMLDEAANICRISDLPELYSHLGSRGICAFTILQSYSQGKRVWGEDGMASLWSAATVKLVGAGIDDARFAEDVSRLVGEHDVTVRSVGHHHGAVSENYSVRRERILPPDRVRALPKGTALVFATGARVAMLSLMPWYRSRRRAEVEAAKTRAEQGITERARLARARRGARREGGAA